MSRWLLVFSVLLLFVQTGLLAVDLTNRLLFPVGPEEMGLGFNQQALLLHGKVSILRGDLMRLEFPPLRNIGDGTLKKLALANASFLIRDQFMWDGILMEVVVEPTGVTRQAFQPASYVRGSVVPFHVSDDLFVPPIGQLDLKANGLGVEGAYRFLGRRLLIEYLRGQGDLDEIKKLWGAIKKTNREAYLQANIDKLKEKEREALPGAAKRSAAHQLQKAQDEQEESRLFRQVCKLVSENAEPKKINPAVNEWVEQLRRMDYCNGLHSAKRGLVELILEAAAAKIKDQYNRKHGTQYRNISTFFQIVLPVKILGPNGTWEWAGVIGRKAHFRSHDDEWHDYLPTSIFGDVLKGANQFSIDGSQVDWELPEIRDPRIRELTEWSDFHGRKLDTLAGKAIDAFMNGDEQAPERLLQKVLAMLDLGAPPEPAPGWVEQDLKPYETFLAAMEQVSVGDVPAHTLKGILDTYAAKKPDSEHLSAVLVRSVFANPHAVDQWLANHLAHLPEVPLSAEQVKARADSEASGTKTMGITDERVDNLLNPILALMKLNGTSSPAVSAVLHQKYHVNYKELIHLAGPEMIRADLTESGREGFPDFFYGNTVHTMAMALTEILTEVLHRYEPNLILRPGSVMLQMGEMGNIPAEALAAQFAKTPAFFHSIFRTAEKLSGKHFPPEVMHFFDPHDGTQFLAHHKLAGEMAARALAEIQAGGCAESVLRAAVTQLPAIGETAKIPKLE